MSSPSKPRLEINWATHKAAKHACENWHYSGCLPSGKIVKVGAWENGSFIGVVLFSRGASPYLLEKYSISQYEGCELTRIALSKHETPVSRIVRIAMQFLKKSCPGLKLVVSFADPEQGHHGGVYQAGNWIYSGTSNPVIEYFIRGKWRHVRGAYYEKNRATPTRTRKGKHRYLMPLDNDMRRRVQSLAKPYPKRVGSADSGTPTVQVGREGANPIPTLQSSSIAKMKEVSSGS